MYLKFGEKVREKEAAREKLLQGNPPIGIEVYSNAPVLNPQFSRCDYDNL